MLTCPAHFPQFLGLLRGARIWGYSNIIFHWVSLSVHPTLNLRTAGQKAFYLLYFNFLLLHAFLFFLFLHPVKHFCVFPGPTMWRSSDLAADFLASIKFLLITYAFIFSSPGMCCSHTRIPAASHLLFRMRRMYRIFLDFNFWFTDPNATSLSHRNTTLVPYHGTNPHRIT